MNKTYRFLFWFGYTAVLSVSTLRIPWALDKVHVGMPHFQIRLDHLLHLLVYFLICMYFFYGRGKGLTLFEKNSLRKFLVAVILLATVSEGIQFWFPYRSFNPMDWISNISGIALGTLVGFKIQDSRFKIQD